MRPGRERERKDSVSHVSYQASPPSFPHTRHHRGFGCHQFGLRLRTQGDEPSANSASGIIGGVAVTSPQLEAVGALVVSDVNGAWQPFCTGTLVAPKVVITAKHCVIDTKLPLDVSAQLLKTFQIAFGLGPNGFAPTRTVRVAEGYVSPLNEGGAAGLGSDVGVYILAEPLTGVAPIALGEPLGAADIGKPFLAVGYGHTTHQMTGNGPKMGGQAPLRAISGSGYRASFPSFEDFYAEWERLEGTAAASEMRSSIAAMYESQLLEGYEVRMGGTNDGFNTCNGDSGGPWLSRRPDGNYQRHGVTSTVGSGPTFKCGFGTGVATFGSIARTIIDSLIASPCLDLPLSSVCEANDVVQCVRSTSVVPKPGRTSCELLPTGAG